MTRPSATAAPGYGGPAGAAPTRHPADPDPARSTKATAVLVLGVFAVLTGPFVGGVVPGVVGLLLAREVRGDLEAAQGFLLGTRRYERGVALCWTGVVLALSALVALTVWGLRRWALTAGVDFLPTVQ
jgi:hypothetical protein